MKSESLSNKLLLTLLSVVTIALFLKTPAIGGWFDHLLLPNWKNVRGFMYKDLDERKLARWGNSYQASIYIKKYFAEHNIEDAVILFEPNEYFKKTGLSFKAPEPITFYYFTGMRGMWMTSERIEEATYFVSVNNQGIMMQKIASREHLAEILNTYKDYKTSL